jgi:hypothetical protein
MGTPSAEAAPGTSARKSAVADEQETTAPPLTDDEKVLLRRCFRIRTLTDDEIVFPIMNPAASKVAWLTFMSFCVVCTMLTCRWVYVPSEAPSLLWLLLSVFPMYGLLWLAAWKRSFLVLKRGLRTMLVDLGDGVWSIRLPQGVAPSTWDFPTASIPFRIGSDEVERVEAAAVIERYAGLSLSAPIEVTPLGLLQKCGVDLVGYDEESVSLANFGAIGSGVLAFALFLYSSALVYPLVAMCIGFCSTAGPRDSPVWVWVFVTMLTTLGAMLLLSAGRESSVATFRMGRREVLLYRGGTETVHRVHENAVAVTSDGDAGQFVVVQKVFSASPICGTANLLAGFLRKYLAPEQPKQTMSDM